jgi:hypothetical protein
VKLSILALVSTVTCIGAATACSSSSGNGFNNGGGDSGTSGEAGTASDSGTGGETGGGSLPYVGEVTASNGTAFTITGAFGPAPTATPTAPMCPATGVSSGSCCYIPPAVASDAGTTTDAGSTAMALSAGTITIKDGAANVAALNPLANGGGYGITGNGTTTNPSVKWTPGDKLSISASGDTVAAFSGSLTTVDDFAGVTPALSLTTATTVPLSADLVIAWTAGNGTNVTTVLALKSGSITCQVSDSAGTVSVPSALLGKLTTAQEGLLTLSRATSTTVTGSNATVTLIGTSVSTGLVKTM